MELKDALVLLSKAPQADKDAISRLLAAEMIDRAIRWQAKAMESIAAEIGELAMAMKHQ